MNENFSITATTKGKLPRLPLLPIKEQVLGKTYSLSLVFIGKRRMQNLNRTYRHIDKPTDILSFPLSDTVGEIYICAEMADKKALLHGRTSRNYLLFLFLHGLVHLSGYDHGDAMEKKEKKIRKMFNI